MPRKNKGESRIYRHDYYLKNRSKEIDWDRKFREKHPDRSKEYGRKLKIEVCDHYSHNDGKPVCVKCGFVDIRALSIDHIYGRGREDYKDAGIYGIGFYQWLKKNNYPKGYQTLCMNCQWIKRSENNELKRTMRRKKEGELDGKNV